MKQVKSVLIFGAGQLGSRHLQSLKSIHIPIYIFVLDVSLTSLKTAEERYNGINVENNNIQNIVFTTDLADIPSEIDLVIMATSSKDRAKLIQSLLSHSKVSNMIIEKVLFQSLAEYDIIAELLTIKEVKTWVNCPRRLFPIYKQIKPCFENTGPYNIVIDGSNWGLGCNTIHFIDLLAYLFNTSDIKIDTAQLDKELLESKRSGYIEFTGTLQITIGEASLAIITSRKTEELPISIYIQTKNRKIIIEEYKKRLWHSSAETEWEWEELHFDIPYQSQLTSIVAEEILNYGHCALTPYKESMKLHTSYIGALLHFMNSQLSLNNENCPIT